MGRLVLICAGLASLLGTSVARAQSNPGAAASRSPPATPPASASPPPASCREFGLLERASGDRVAYDCAAAHRVACAADANAMSNPSTASAMAMAHAAFREGTLLARQARWVDALDAFERSDALHAHAITTYNIGYCERLLGSLDPGAQDAPEGPRQSPGARRSRAAARSRRRLATQTYLTEAERPESRARARDRHGRGWCRGRGRPSAGARAFRRTLPCCWPETRPMGPAEAPPAPRLRGAGRPRGACVRALDRKAGPMSRRPRRWGPGQTDGRSSCGRRAPKRLASRAIP